MLKSAQSAQQIEFPFEFSSLQQLNLHLIDKF